MTANWFEAKVKYMKVNEDEKKRRQIDEKEVRSVLGIEEPDEDITRMAKKGW